MTALATGEAARFRHFPILTWLPSYSLDDLRPDIFAGLSAWAVIIPEVVAYAQIAEVPAAVVLAAAPAALIAYALLGTSRQAIVGGTSALAIVSAATVGPLAGGNAVRFGELTVVLTLLVGLLFFLFGLARLGFLSEFLAKPVVGGFVFGLGLVIAAGQLPKMLGVAPGHGNFFQKIWVLLTESGRVNLWTLLVGALSLALLFGMQHWMPRLPGALVIAVGGILAGTAFQLNQHGVAVVGALAAGLPRLDIPAVGWADVTALLPAALGLVLVASAEHLSVVRSCAAAHEYDIDPDGELVALGVANLGAGLFGGFAVGGSLSRTTVNDRGGARTQLSSLAAAIAIFMTAIALTPLLHNLPQATLAAIVLNAVWRLFNVSEFRRYLAFDRHDLLLALAALVGVLVLNVLPGLLTAVGLSIFLLIYRSSRPRVAVLGQVPGERTYGDISRHPEYATVPGLLVVRLDAPLFFANAGLLRDRIWELIHRSASLPLMILLDVEATDHLDLTSSDMLCGLQAELETEGIVLGLARARTPILEKLDRSGLSLRMGAEHIYLTVDNGVRAFRRTFDAECAS